VLFPEALKIVTSFVIGGEYWIHVCYAKEAELKFSYFYLTPLRHLFPIIFYRCLCCSAPGRGACSQNCRLLKTWPRSYIDINLVRFHRWHQSPFTRRWESRVIVIVFIRWRLCNCRSCWMHLGRKRSYACNFLVTSVFDTYNILQAFRLYMDRRTCLW